MYRLNNRPFTQSGQKFVKAEGIHKNGADTANAERRDFLKGEFKEGTCRRHMKLRVFFIKITELRKSGLAALDFIQEQQGFAGHNGSVAIERQLGTKRLRGKGGIEELAGFYVLVKIDFDKIPEMPAKLPNSRRFSHLPGAPQEQGFPVRRRFLLPGKENLVYVSGEIPVFHFFRP
jgi:hypothetical protein